MLTIASRLSIALSISIALSRIVWATSVHWDSSAEVILSFACKSLMCVSTSILRLASDFTLAGVEASGEGGVLADTPVDCAYALLMRNVDASTATIVFMSFSLRMVDCLGFVR
ncbi:exported hypothetical protein [Burkholderiales bacterium]|nr:exported hypothetical protein [Burkholderiales bacterium]